MCYNYNTNLCYNVCINLSGGVDTASTDGVFDISNADRIGQSEVALVQKVVDGVQLLVQVHTYVYVYITLHSRTQVVCVIERCPLFGS